MNATLSTDPVLPDEVIQAIKNGNKIEAIKLLREKTGLGLKESKDLVDAYVDNHLAGSQPIRKSDSSNGLLILSIALGLTAYAVYRFLG